MGVMHRELGLTVPVREALDPVWWRERYAFGHILGELAPTLTDPRTGRPLSQADREALQETVGQLPDNTIRWHLRSAMSELEIKLGVPMGVVIVKSTPLDAGEQEGVTYDRVQPRLPFVRANVATHYRIELPGPVLSVERVRLYSYNLLVLETGLNLSVEITDPIAGVIHLLPKEGATGFPLYNPSDDGQSVLPIVWDPLQPHGDNYPSAWSIDYTQGPRGNYGGNGMIEAALAHWVACKAGIVLLSISGLAQTRGIASLSRSMDGLSVSIGLQASAIYGVNSATENAFKEAEKAIDWKALRAYKRGIIMRGY